MASLLLIFAGLLNIGVAVALGAASHFWWRASRISLPPSVSYDVRPSLASLQEYGLKIGERGKLNARAGVCIALAAVCQAGSMGAFLVARAQS